MSESPILNRILKKVDVKFGAPHGRINVGKMPTFGRVFRATVRLREGYDKGGAYWGIGKPLKVCYTKDLSYIEFYREGNKPPIPEKAAVKVSDIAYRAIDGLKVKADIARYGPTFSEDLVAYARKVGQGQATVIFEAVILHAF